MTKSKFLFSVGALLFLISIFNSGTANKFDGTELYRVSPESSSHYDAHIALVKLREKRDTPTIYAKNQYESVPQNANATIGDVKKPVETAAPSNISSIVVPYKAVDMPLLGVNGTGQRKDAGLQLSQPKTTIVSAPIQPTVGAAAALPTAPKNSTLSQETKAIDQPTETPEEKVLDSVDVPDNETLSEIQKTSYTVNSTNDHHTYYNSSIYVDQAEADRVWESVKNSSFNSMLSQSHRRAMTVELSFEFPFYGHPVRNVTVATGGFLYTGDYVHSWLAATQYIAPLMANFDTSLSNESFVRTRDNGTAFTVIWEKVSLQDKKDVGKFTFSATLHKNGNIVFIYYYVPIDINAIQDDKHPVKVGLSDAYIIDKTVFYTRRKTIYEYHRINLSNNGISNATIIYLQALPTCLDYKDCAACINHKTSFDCAWCPTLNRCSTGTDRKKQEWQHKGCDRTQIVNTSACPALGQKGNNAIDSGNTNASTNTTPTDVPTENVNNNQHESSTHVSDTNSATVTPVHDDNHAVKVMNEALESHAESKSMGLALGFLVPICLVLTVVLWVFYAYRNPHTKSGQLLIQYRPSQWSWRRGEARYTAATIHM
ncbi:PREDICTED: plexin domain-containing protein 2 isoform X2 [Bactrocera latifrons]|uniref:plexin domain-containing protein 2 isoform X2 n=1 Tax=Bactrocera latifrons TaxID=174628 RepID=UPI0008DCB1CF|nr:PREDICTED: plexin domain-containing protein 2 isoform X2 [Bactrocera latifrons]